MQGIVIRWLITTIAILIATELVSGVKVQGFTTALAAAAILGVLNALVRPLLIILTLPLTIVTLGVFILVINALLFQLAGAIISGLVVDSFWSALWASLIVSLVSWVTNYWVVGGHQERVIIETRRRQGAGDTIEMRRGRNGKWE
jgi:putative membrane protein